MKQRTIILTIETNEDDNVFSLYAQALGKSVLVTANMLLSSPSDHLDKAVSTAVAYLYDLGGNEAGRVSISDILSDGPNRHYEP